MLAAVQDGEQSPPERTAATVIIDVLRKKKPDGCHSHPRPNLFRLLLVLVLAMIVFRLAAPDSPADKSMPDIRVACA